MTLKDKNLYFVGGVVRDEILGVASFDTDYCYEGDAIEFSKILNVIKTNPDFGTVRVIDDGNEIDIASTRIEEYPRKGHLPKVTKIGCSLKDDLRRRDFTINAMAKRTTDGEIIDYFDGCSDIEKKLLKILHKDSFIDDPTRIIRGLKFSVRLGFELEEKTRFLQDDYLENINYDMSYHRVKKELVETFNLNKAEAFDKFVEQGIYRLLGKNQIAPEIKGKDIENALQGTDFTPWLIYMSFFNLSNIELTRAEKRILEWADRLKTDEPTNNTPKESIIIHRLRNA